MERQWILEAPVDLETAETILGRVTEIIHQGGSLRIVTLNPEMVMAARHNPELAQALLDGHFVVPDGIGIIMALQCRGVQGRRIAGVDLAEMIMKQIAPWGGRIFLLGGQAGVAERAGRVLTQRFPGLTLAGTADGFFDEAREQQILEAIRRSHPHLLLVGMGVPRQEIWLSTWWKQLNVSVGMGIGGGLDLWAGKTTRAPLWMRSVGLEWVYRVVREPWRLRRLHVIPSFIVSVLLGKGRKSEHV